MFIRLIQFERHVRRRLAAVHGDERGAISILTVFVMLAFTWLLMMILNVAIQLDDKVRMQNGVDAATYSGGVVLARGMNAIAFANHLEADVFAITAFLREASNREAESYVPEILAAWGESGSLFSGSPFLKFDDPQRPLSQAISNKLPLEQEFVRAWSEMAAAAARNVLPVYEYILGTPETEDPGADDHLLPRFQSEVLLQTPELAQQVMDDMAYRHGMRQADLDAYSRSGQRPRTQQGDRGDQVGVLWRAHENYVDPVNDFDSQSYPVSRTLPVIDPQSDFPEQVYLQEARQMRQWLARHYLDDWINDRDPRRGLEFADEEARMSQFARLFHAAACIQLDKLLNEEYPNTNLPFILRDFVGIDAARQAGAVQDDIVEPPIEGDFVWEIDDERLNNDFSFVGVAYRPHVELRAHDFFTDGPDERLPLDRQADAVTFAQIRMFIPRRRFYCCPWAVPTYTETGNPAGWYPNTDNWNFNWRDRNRQRYQKYAWSTFNQNWTIKLVPATAQSIPDILSAPPPPGSPVERAGLRTPQGLRRMSPENFRVLNTH